MNKFSWSGFLVVLMMAPQVVCAGNFINTAGGGSWDSAASWTAGSGYPGAGDTIGLSGAGTITAVNSQQFGATSGSSASTWGTTDNMILGLTNSAVLTHNVGDTFTVTPPNNLYLRGGFGGERFLNLGTFVNNSGFRVVHLINGVTFEERGTNTFANGYASIAIDGASKMFVNNGTINVTQSGYIGAKAAGATFTTFDGSTLQGVNISIAAGKEFGLGYYYNSSANTLTGQVKIASLSVGSGGTLSFGNVNMTVSTPATLTAVGGLNIGYIAGGGVLSTFAVGNGATWNFGGGVTIQQGSTLKLQGNSVTNVGSLTTVGGANVFVDGGTGGRLVLQGTNSINQGYRGVNGTNGATVEIQGTLSFMQDNNDSGFALDGTSKLFVNGGTISATRSGGIGAFGDGGTFSTYDTASSTLKSLTVNISSNSTLSLGTDINNTYQPMNKRLDGRAKVAAMNIDAGSTLQIGRYNNLTFQGAFTANGILSVANLATFALDTNLTVNFGQGLQADGGTIDTRGNVLTLQGTTNVVCSSGASTTTLLASNATGCVDNQGTLYVGPSAGASYRGLTVKHSTGGVAFVNDGTVVLRNGDFASANQSALDIFAGTTFSNAAGGLLVGKSLAYPLVANVFGENSSTSIFDNQGTVQVVTNTLTFSTITIPQLSGTSLNGGTWKATGTNSVLTLPGSNLTTINTNAAVYLENGGSINRIGTTLTTVYGRFMVNGMSFTTGASGLAVTNGGVLGGSGTLVGNVAVASNSTLDAGSATGTAGTFTINGNVTLAAGARVNCDYTASTNDQVVVNGTLTLPAVATVNTVGSAKLTQPMTILSATTLSAPGGVGGWTLTGGLSGARLSVVGSTVQVVPRLTGTVISTL